MPKNKRVGKTTTLPKARRASAKVNTRANSKAQTTFGEVDVRMLSCSSCEDNYESGSTGSSDVLCSHCFVPLEHLAFEKRKTTGIQKPKKKSKLLQTTAVKEPSSFGLNDTLDVG